MYIIFVMNNLSLASMFRAMRIGKRYSLQMNICATEEPPKNLSSFLSFIAEKFTELLLQTHSQLSY